METVYRKSTAADKDGILGIGCMFNGLDYIQHAIDRLLTEPSCVCYVAEYNGQVVGFSCIVVQDGGHSAVEVAVRVHPDHSSRGIGVEMGKRLREASSALHPIALDKLLIVTIDAKYYRRNVVENPHKFICLQKMTVHSYRATIEKVKHFSPRVKLLEATTKPGDEEFLAFMQKEKSRLFSDDVVVCFDPHDFSEISLRLIHKNNQVFMSADKASISFFHIFSVSVGIRIDMDVFCLNSSAVHAHVAAMLNTLAAMDLDGVQNVELVLCTLPGMNLCEGDILQDEIGWKRGSYIRWLIHLRS